VNKLRKRLFIFYLLVVAFLCIFLPWKTDIRDGKWSNCYSMIWSPPNELSVVDFGRLFLEIVAVTILTIAAIILIGNTEKQNNQAATRGSVINEIQKVKRQPLAAILLSILTPGLGQVYNGQLIKGGIFYFAFFLLPIVFAYIGLQYEFKGLIVFIASIIFFFLFIVGDAFFVSHKIKIMVLKSYNKWYIYFLLMVLSLFFLSLRGNFFYDILGIKAYNLPADSMTPTLLPGDKTIIDLKYYDTNIPRKGDVITFKYPGDPSKIFLKRVIAVEGDVIELRDKIVYLNGQPIEEQYIIHLDDSILPCGQQRVEKEGGGLLLGIGYSITKCEQPRDNFGPNKIPHSKIFVMGDNRDQSFDSRYWGYVDRNEIEGKALYIYWSNSKNKIGIRIE
jgi:signal peptidase I